MCAVKLACAICSSGDESATNTLRRPAPEAATRQPETAPPRRRRRHQPGAYAPPASRSGATTSGRALQAPGGSVTLRDTQKVGDDVEDNTEDQDDQVQERQRDQDAFGAHRTLLLTGAQARPEPAPVTEEIVDSPDGEDRVDQEQPLVDDPTIAADLSLRVLFDLAVSRVTLRCLVAHVRSW